MPWGVSWDKLFKFLLKNKSCYCCEHYYSMQDIYDDDDEEWDAGKCEIDGEFVDIETSCNYFRLNEIYKDSE